MPIFPFGGSASPVAPHRRAIALLVRGGVEGAREDVARVHPLVEQVDGLALARPAHPGDQDDHRERAVFFQAVLDIQQVGAQLRHRAIENGLRDPATKFRGLEHALAILR